MPNMSYCRFQNTYRGLEECVDNWDDPESEQEEVFQNKIVELAKEIVQLYGE